MNYEQLCYLRTVIPCRDKEIFEAFDKAASLHAMIKAFEAGVPAASKSFIDEQALQSSSATPPNQYTKPAFEDFGATPVVAGGRASAGSHAANGRTKLLHRSRANRRTDSY